jgi:sugar phosphate isomerase/epimerase
VFDWIDEVERELKPLGVTGLEMYHGFFPVDDTDFVQRVRSAMDQAGLAMPMFCASPDFTHPDKAARLKEVERQCRMIDVAAQLGSETCRVLSGQRRPEVSRAEGIDWVVECIDSLLPHAENAKIILVLENHFKDNYWSHPEFAQKMELFCEIVERLESPWFGVNYDPSNTLLAAEDPYELLDRVKHRVVSMHASDRRPKPGVTLAPGVITDYTQLIHGEIGTGLIDYDRIFTVLREVGFDGWVSIEDGVTGIEELKRSARFVAGKMVGT